MPRPSSDDGPFLGLAAQQYVLEKTRIGARLPVDSYLINTMRVDRHETYEDMFGQLVYSLEAFVLQDKMPPQTIRDTKNVVSPATPATWWDHFKKDKVAADKWYWRWLGKLKPPLMYTEIKEITFEVNLERWISYPEAQNIPETFGTRYHGYSVDQNFWETSW